MRAAGTEEGEPGSWVLQAEAGGAGWGAGLAKKCLLTRVSCPGIFKRSLPGSRSIPLFVTGFSSSPGPSRSTREGSATRCVRPLGPACAVIASRAGQ